MLEVQRVRDAHDARVCLIVIHAHGQSHLNGLTVVVHERRDLAAVEHFAGDAVDVHGVEIELFDRAHGRGRGKTEPLCVAVRGLVDVERDDVLAFDAAGGVGGRELAGYVRIHAIAAEILAALVHDEQLAAVDEDARHVCKCALQQDRLLLVNVGCVDRDELRRLVIGIFDRGDREQDRRVFDDGLAEHGHVLGHVLEPGAVARLGTDLLAEADGHHFHDAALKGPAERRVRLDAAVDDDAVRLGRVFVDEHVHAVGVDTDLLDLHGREDRAADGLLRHAVAGEHGALTLGGRAAVTAHCRNDERVRAAALDEVRDRFRDDRDIGHTARADRDGDAHAGTDLARVRRV